MHSQGSNQTERQESGQTDTQTAIRLRHSLAEHVVFRWENMMPYFTSAHDDTRRNSSRLAGTLSPSGALATAASTLAELSAGFIWLLELAAGAGF